MMNPAPVISKKLGMTLIGDENQYARIDPECGFIIAGAPEHAKIHAGLMYSCFHFGTGKNDGDTINIYFKTPSNEIEYHCYSRWAGSGAAVFRIYEAPTITANSGTHAKLPINHERNNPNASGVFDNATSPAEHKFSIDVTKTGDGTLAWQEYSGAAKSQGASGRSEEELVLKPNTAYCFVVESDASGLTLSMDIQFYLCECLGQLNLVA